MRLMKKVTIALVALSLAASVAMAQASPGQINKLRAAWDAADPTEEVQGYYVYYRTNWPAGMSLTAPTDDGLWLRFGQATNTFLNFPTNQVPQKLYLTVTSSNMWGESVLSAVAQTPAKPGSQSKNVRIEKQP